MAARRTAIVFGANTEVGKTLCSAALIKAGLRRFGRAAYLKPLQTGVDDDHAGDAALVGATTPDGLGRCDTLHAWRACASRTAAPRGRKVDKYRATRSSPEPFLSGCARATSPSASSRPPAAACRRRRRAGPRPTLHAGLDVPALLVGDARLGGISCSLCAWEALVRRGFDVRSIVFVGDDAALGNAEAVRAVTGLGDGVLATVAPPPRPAARRLAGRDGVCFDAVCASVLFRVFCHLVLLRTMTLLKFNWPFRCRRIS